MTTTLNNGTTNVVPDLLMGWSSAADAATVVHPIIGTAAADVTLRVAQKRSGTMRLLFKSPSAAATAEGLHRVASVWTLVSTDQPMLNMTYVVAGGAVSLTNAEDDGRIWTLDIAYQET